MTTYTSNIPASTDNPSDSQSLIKDNFTAIAEMVTQNHVEMSDTTNRGKHNFMQMPEQASAPAVAANEAGLYSQESSLTGNTELVFRRESNGTQIEFTGLSANTNGWTRLPSGILLKWGTGTATGSDSQSFPTGATIPVFTAVYNGLVCIEDTSATPNTFVTLKTITKTQINVFGSSRTTTGSAAVTFRYLVIGA